MTLVLADRVRETTTTTGTADVVMGGAVLGFQNFDVIGNGNTTFYGIVGRDTSEWEIGIGTYTLSTSTLARTTVLSSSAGGTTKVTFSTGTKDVFCTQPAVKSLILPNARSVYGNSFDGSADLTQVIASTYGGTGNGFAHFTGPTTSEKTFTLPNSSATLLYSGGELGTPSSGTLVNCTFPTLNQSTTGNAATATVLDTARNIYGNSFDGSAALTQVIASTYGGTGNGFAKFSGPATSEKTYSLPNSNATLLYSGGALGTPASGIVTNFTGTASININGTVGATTPNTGEFTKATLSAANSTATYGGQIYLGGATGNRIDFNAVGVGVPTTTTRSLGTKIVYYGTTPGAEYATGIESNYLWNATASTATGFKWYGGTTLAATLTGAGALTLGGGMDTGGAISATGNVIAGLTVNTGQLVAIQGSGSSWYAAMLRNDGANVYLLSSNVQTTESAARAAPGNAFRPLLWSLSTGAVAINSTASGVTNIDGTQINLDADTVVTGALTSTNQVNAAVSMSISNVAAPGSSYHLTFGGDTAKTISMERNPTTNTAGNNLSLTAGHATASATNKNGGSLVLRPGVSTGTGSGSVFIQGSVADVAGTTDNAYLSMVTVTGNKLGFYNATPVVKASAPTAATAVAPAGGTGTTAGGWDTAAHRDTAIAAINNLMTRVAFLETVIANLGLTA
jgi:hypothetical protein